MYKKIMLTLLVLAVIVLSACKPTTFDALGEEELQEPDDGSVCLPPEDTLEGATTVESTTTVESITMEEATTMAEVTTTVVLTTTTEAVTTPTTVEDGVPTFTTMEGDLLKVAVKAYDADGDILTYEYTNPLDSRGEWQTTVGDAGTYEATITVSDGKSTSKQKVLLFVKKSNQVPIITGVADIYVDEGEIVKFSTKVSDPDGDDVTVSYSGWMTKSEYTTTFNDAGEYKVTITATDGKEETTRVVTVTVFDRNRAPVIEGVGDVQFNEGQLAKIEGTFSDDDDDALQLSYSAPFDDNGEWKTEIGDAGSYDVVVKASDGKLETSKKIKVTVVSLNHPPTIEPIADMLVNIGDTVMLNPVVFDVDGDQLTISYSGWMTEDEYTTTEQDSGTHNVLITVSDGEIEKTEEVSITVNTPPVFVTG